MTLKQELFKFYDANGGDFGAALDAGYSPDVAAIYHTKWLKYQDRKTLH